jgi:hypothetical protein
MHWYLNRGALVALALSICGGAQAATSWQDLKVGGGGFVRGLIVHSDGTMVGRTDTAGAYLWNGSSWVQLVTNTSIPASYLATDPDGIGEASGGYGVYEIAIAPSNSSIMYMNFGGYVFKSTNKGGTWTQTGFPAQGTGCNPNDNYAQTGQKMAVDPNNSNIVYAGTETRGMYVTTNGGTSWTQASGVPSGTGAGITGILFYPGGGQAGGVTQVIYASSNGHGVYQTTNGGSTWTLLSGGPADVEYAAISTSGIYYAVGNGNSNVWSYNGSAWTKLISGVWQGIAINPFNQNELAVTLQSGQVDISYNAGATWTGENTNTSLSTNDIPWLLAGNSLHGSPSPFFYLSAGGLQFSPVNNGQLILSAGTGMWSMNVPASGATSSAALTWTDFSVGIENLVANAILVPPVAVSAPLLASWDRPFFKITNPNVFPSTYGPVNSDTIQMGWSLDYASSNPATVVAFSTWSGSQSGYSTDGGTTWTYFPAVPSGSGGEIAATTPQNIIMAPSGSTPQFTTNQGASWTAISVPGISSWGAFHNSWQYKKRGVTADRVLPNTFYLYYGGYGVFKSTDGGATWANVYNGNKGYIDPGSTGFAYFNAWLSSVPGNAGHLFYTGGWQLGGPPYPVNEHFYRSTNGGTTWTAVPNVMQVTCFGFGAPAPGQTYPAIYIAGFVNNVYGVWQSTDDAQTWTQIGTYPLGNLVRLSTISGDPNIFGQVYAGFDGGGYAYLPGGGSGTQVLVPMAPTNLTVK